MNIYSTILCLFLMCACFQSCESDRKTSDDSGNKSQNEMQTVNAVNGTNNHNSPVDLINDGFVDRILLNEITYEVSIQRANAHLLEMQTREKESEVLFFSNQDTFIFFKNNKTAFLRRFYISSKNTTIDTNITIGIEKSFFYKKFNVPSLPDSFHLSELEGHCDFSFFFKNDTLYKIEYMLRYED